MPAILLAPGALRGAQAQRLLQVSGAKHSLSVTVAVGKTEDVRIDSAFTDITIGDSDVADISPLTDRTISILGKKIGTTRVTLYGEGKMQIGLFDIEV
ncbi:MAG TPA: pilus assembly protein N-terminal domain-containing protein, partial [Xanthobacteraceae bacterium]|nr:pilus assembly protein N-terminal domain-containing protein [Xanthobacteraceae bacterium]